MTRMRTTMPIQNEILRLKGLKHNKTRVAKLLGINRETVIKYWDGPVADLAPLVPDWVKDIDWDYANKELKKTTKKILYNEFKDVKDLPSTIDQLGVASNYIVNRTFSSCLKLG
jgi:hypothetical protein